MRKTYVTFGQIHTHRVNNHTFDCDSVAVIEASTDEDGRNLAFEYFGGKFFTTYTEDQWQPALLEWFPRGLIKAN